MSYLHTWTAITGPPFEYIKGFIFGSKTFIHLSTALMYAVERAITNFTITAEIHAHSLANFYCQYADRHMNLKFMQRVSERERAIRQFVIIKNKLMSVCNASVLFYQWISSWHCQSSLRIHSAIASWIHSYFDNVMTKFMINNRTDA